MKSLKTKPRGSVLATLAGLAMIGTLPLAQAAGTSTADTGWHGKAEAPHYQEEIFPPWQHGANDDALDKGFKFTVPEVDDMADFHGNLDNPKLILYIGGNYFFAVAPLVKAFEQEHSKYKGHVFVVTIPPGLEVKAMKAGGTFTSGNMTFTIKPDAYLAGLKKVKSLIASGMLTGPAIAYATNDLTIMIPKDNPGHITGIKDLAKPGIKLVMPNPAFEGIARQIEASLKKAGGATLEQKVYDTGVKDGSTILTHIHHRQTPLFLMQGLADAGITWKSEAIFQEQAGHPISNIDLPAKYNTTAIYGGALVKDAAHPAAAKAWLAFVQSPTALKIFEHYGFKPYNKS
ncbi:MULTISPECIES: substrate-binding domain-containing protein [Acidiphilium]|uniref:ABC-type molybdate transport system, substrate-binding protein n=1 Tax=Acidiphilium rubrum TaxID=526 RepID=A0A8G2CP19_ACIRU|nr:substrate-binding domain-containing protein [Acidiphilium sp. PA]SIR54090.1 ABC-type molybdate transport system, substrate-binding protein [Acidiphilium rubrum]